jgi:hypothetical protein
VTAVQAKFYADSSIRSEAIDVSAQNGVVTLRGGVPAANVRQQAARSVNGVTHVNDQMAVDNAIGKKALTEDEGRPGWITTKRNGLEAMASAEYRFPPRVRKLLTTAFTSWRMYGRPGCWPRPQHMPVLL